MTTNKKFYPISTKLKQHMEEYLRNTCLNFHKDILSVIIILSQLNIVAFLMALGVFLLEYHALWWNWMTPEMLHIDKKLSKTLIQTHAIAKRNISNWQNTDYLFSPFSFFQERIHFILQEASITSLYCVLPWRVYSQHWYYVYVLVTSNFDWEGPSEFISWSWKIFLINTKLWKKSEGR